MENLSNGAKTSHMSEFYLELYRRTFIVFIGGNVAEINAKLTERLGVPTEFDCGDCWGCCDMIVGKDITAIVTYIASSGLSDEDIDTISHEAVHAANFVYKKCGIRHSRSNDEPFAYLVGYIVKKFVGAVNEYNAERQRLSTVSES